jgi:hypothetical protein
VLAISTALFWGGAVWMLYLALEPYVRRYWPQAIISWTRVLAGRWRDPLVGRDVVLGVSMASSWAWARHPLLRSLWLRVLLRKGWLGAVAFVLLFAALKSVSSDYPGVSWPIQAILYAALGAGALRYGLVMLTVALYTADLALNIPATLNPSAWYFSTATVVLATIAALAIWGFYTALAGQTPWKAEA